MANTKSDTARANGSKSKGPITPEGKARSSRNAVRHGLRAEFNVLSHESEDDFQLLLDAFIYRYQPADAVELELVHEMAIARWRLRRIGNLETELFDNEITLCDDYVADKFAEIDDDARFACVFQKMADEGKALALLMRYETSLARVYERAVKQLDALQNRKLPSEPTRALSLNPLLTSPSDGTADFRPREASDSPEPHSGNPNLRTSSLNLGSERRLSSCGSTLTKVSIIDRSANAFSSSASACAFSPRTA
jgi:hypothetical protein